MKKIYTIIFILLLNLLLITSCSSKITVIYQDFDGRTIKEEKIKNLEDSQSPIPSDKDGCKFVGWEKEELNDKKIIMKPVYDKLEYKVIFKDGNGKVLKEEIVAYNGNATSPNVSEIEGYIFKGWDKEFNNVKSDLTITAIYEIKTYTVKFYDDNNSVYKEFIVKHGESIDDLTLNDTNSHIFKGWDKEYKNITSNLEIKPIYEKKVYTVTFVDDEGNVLKTEQVRHGEDAEGLKPEKKGYLTFMGWDKSLYEIMENTTITAIYGQLEHKITFYDGTEKLDFGVNSYKEGEEIVLPIYNKEGYQFDGWYLSNLSMTEYQYVDKNSTSNLTFYARTTPLSNLNPIVLPKSTYNFETINKNLHSSGTSYVYQPKFPTGPATSVTLYDWSTSNSSVATVSAYSSISAKSSGYCVLTARLKSDPTITINCVIKVTTDGIFISSEEEANKHELVNITFKGKNGEIIKEMKCLKGGEVIYPIPLTYEGYKFVGWDKDNYILNSDTIITAMYEKGDNRYVGKTFSIIGDSISTYEGYIPEGFSAFYPYPTADVSTVHKTWWMQVINKLGGSLFVNNSYSGTCVATASKYSTRYKTRLNYCLLNNIAPDIIIIYMGSNDCASKYVNLDDFDQAYLEMLNNLKELCPNSEIILCTLATSIFYKETDRIAYGEVIKKYGKEFDYKVIDLENADISDKLVDTAHPNTSGMNEVAEEILKQIIN